MATPIPSGSPHPGHPAYGVPRPVTPLATVVLCRNPGEMTFEGTNTYVLRAPGSATSVVVDPGPDQPDHHEVVHSVAGKVELVLVTHRHPDHTEGIDALLDRVGAPVRAHAAEHSRAAAPLVHGEVVRAAGLDLEIVGAPGHTADSLVVLVRAAGSRKVDSIVLGDTILGRDSAVLDSRDGDLGAYLDTLDALTAVGEGVTGLPGHGPEVADTAAAARFYAAHRRERLDQVRAAREELGPGADAEAITRHVYTDVTPFLLRVAEQSTKVALRYLDR